MMNQRSKYKFEAARAVILSDKSDRLNAKPGYRSIYLQTFDLRHILPTAFYLRHLNLQHFIYKAFCLRSNLPAVFLAYKTFNLQFICVDVSCVKTDSILRDFRGGSNHQETYLLLLQVEVVRTRAEII